MKRVALTCFDISRCSLPPEKIKINKEKKLQKSILLQ